MNSLINPHKMEVTINKTECTLVFSRYQSNHRTSLQLIEVETGEPYMTASVNMPDVHLSDDMICIKNYSENEGILNVLIDANILLPLDLIQSGIMKCMFIIPRSVYEQA
jgi:hypothetical protein